MTNALEGLVAVVTGGASGIGEAVVHRLARMGARVNVLDTNGDAASATAAAVNAAGGSAQAHVVDVRELESVTAVVDSCATELGRIDILVNSAGIVRKANVADMALEDWRAIIDVNLTGVLVCCKAALPHMQRQGSGRVVSISSRGGFVSPAGLSAYAASKAGITAMSRSLAKEVAEDGITVNLVAPGLVRTPLAEWFHNGADNMSADASNREGLRALIEPEDIAASVAFLCTQDARYITGQTIHVNGGAYMP